MSDSDDHLKKCGGACRQVPVGARVARARESVTRSNAEGDRRGWGGVRCGAVRSGGTQRGSREATAGDGSTAASGASEERNERTVASRLGLWRSSLRSRRSRIDSRQQPHSISYKQRINRSTTSTPEIDRSSVSRLLQIEQRRDLVEVVVVDPDGGLDRVGRGHVDPRQFDDLERVVGAAGLEHLAVVGGGRLALR